MSFFFKKHRRRFVYLILFIRLLDSDIDNFDSEPYLLSDFDLTTSPQMSDTERICDFDVEVIDNASHLMKIEDFCVLRVFRRLGKLKRDGYISKDQILRKYLDNMTSLL